MRVGRARADGNLRASRIELITAIIAGTMPIASARIVAYDILRKSGRAGMLPIFCTSRPREWIRGMPGWHLRSSSACCGIEAQLDYLIEHFSGRRQKLDPEVRTVLRMGVYQLRYLERVPAHAAVQDSRGTGEAGAQDFGHRVRERGPATGRITTRWSGPPAKSSCRVRSGCWRAGSGNTVAEVAEGIARAALQAPENYVAPAGR